MFIKLMFVKLLYYCRRFSAVPNGLAWSPTSPPPPLVLILVLLLSALVSPLPTSFSTVSVLPVFPIPSFPLLFIYNLFSSLYSLLLFCFSLQLTFFLLSLLYLLLSPFPSFMSLSLLPCPLSTCSYFTLFVCFFLHLRPPKYLLPTALLPYLSPRHPLCLNLIEPNWT